MRIFDNSDSLESYSPFEIDSKYFEEQRFHILEFINNIIDKGILNPQHGRLAQSQKGVWSRLACINTRYGRPIYQGKKMLTFD